MCLFLSLYLFVHVNIQAVWPFLIKFLFSNSWVMWVLYVWVSSPLSDVGIADILSQCVAPLIIFLMCLSQNKKVSILIKSSLSFFPFMVHDHGVMWKKPSLPNPKSLKLFFLFSVKSFIVLCFTHYFWFWVNFCVKYEVKIEINFLCASKFSCSNVIYWKGYPFSIELPLHFYKNHLVVLVWFYSWTLSWIDLCVSFTKYHTVLISVVQSKVHSQKISWLWCVKTVIALTLFFSKLF